MKNTARPVSPGPASGPVLECRELRRVFGRGDKARVAVDGVSFGIGAGEVLALVGPNGAGKTTTVRMCSTLLTPTAGQVLVDGVDTQADLKRARQQVGLVLGGERGFYLRASAYENLRLFAAIAKAPTDRASIMAALATVGLADRASSRVEGFSRGMIQRLHIARSIVGSPRLLLLDEPTIGLDPQVAREVRELVRLLAASGTAILLTSHNMVEVAELAGQIVIINHGHLVAQGTSDEIMAAAGISHVTSSLTTDQVIEAELAQALPGAQYVHVAATGSMTEVVIGWSDGRESLADHPDLVAVRGELRREVSLEDAYLRILAHQPAPIEA